MNFWNDFILIFKNLYSNSWAVIQLIGQGSEYKEAQNKVALYNLYYLQEPLANAFRTNKKKNINKWM